MVGREVVNRKIHIIEYLIEKQQQQAKNEYIYIYIYIIFE